MSLQLSLLPGRSSLPWAHESLVFLHSGSLQLRSRLDGSVSGNGPVNSVLVLFSLSASAVVLLLPGPVLSLTVLVVVSVKSSVLFVRRLQQLQLSQLQ
jgi:hypothetical protein